MTVYIVTITFADYDEGGMEIVGVYDSLDKAHVMRGYFDMACELDYESAEKTKKFLWGRYENHTFDVATWAVE